MMKNERGAVIIQMAVCMLGLMAFSAFVVDHGILYVARGQLQNAADAGALAGAITLTADISKKTAATAAAIATAQQNAVWGQTLAASDILVSPLMLTCPDGTQSCIRVDVFRGGRDRNGGQHTNTMPTFFAQLVGVNSQSMLATATAEIMTGNATNCLKPWFIPDLWQENSVPANGTFNVGVDTYTPPNPGPGTGYSTAQIGQVVTLANGDPGSAIAPSVYFQADLDGNGAANYLDNIKNCNGIVKEINPRVPPTCPGGADDPGCVNFKNGRDPVKSAQGAQYLIDQDSGATVDSHGIVSGSCAPNCSAYPGRLMSPRIVPVALFDPAAYAAIGSPSGNQTLPIVNIMAFFIQSTVSSGKDKGNITGVLIGDAALFVAGGGSGGPGASFLKIPGLIR